MTGSEQLADDVGFSPSAWGDLMQQLYRIIAEEGDGKCWAWINPANGDPELGDEIESTRIVVPINHRSFDQRFAPYLVQLDLSRLRDDSYFQASVVMAWHAWSQPLLSAQRGQPVCGWIVADASGPEIARYWANHCHLHAVAGQMRLLRFHDPGVREMLWEDLNETQRLQLLGPVKALLAINRHETLMRHALSPPGSGVEKISGTAPPPHFLLDQDQWRRIADYAILHAAWVHGLAEGSILRSRKIDSDVRVSMRIADSYGLQSEGDRTLFALLALCLGSAFHTDARLSEVWRLTREGETLAHAIEQVSKLPAEQLSMFLAYH